jgi:spore coat protein A
MLKRRTFLKTGAILGTGLFVPWELLARNLVSKAPLAATTLTKYADPLPLPQVIQPTGSVGGVPLYQVSMSQFKQKLHSQLPPTTLWGYNGSYPGPTFEVRSGAPIAVKWTSSLPSAHFLPIDTFLHGAEPSKPAVRSVVHLHGAKVLPDSDGYPDSWFTSGFDTTGPTFSRKIYHYPNDQAAAALWYHDHSLGITRLNVFAGLAGLYFIRDTAEAALNLPSGPYEIPLMIQDRMFNTDGSLFYPMVDLTGETDPNVPPVWVPEFFGDTVLVNGKVWPYLEVEPRKYRFRILNGANARVWHLTLNESTSAGASLGRPGPVFNQIGTDGGLLPRPVPQKDLLIAPAERFDVIIDFSGQQGKCFVLNNDAPAPFPGGGDVVPSEVMLFKVTKPLRSRDTSSLPASLVPVPLLRPSSTTKQRNLILTELDSAADNPIIGLLDNAHWDDPVIEAPRAGSTEIWNIMNLTGDTHPIHVHLVEFQVLDRQALQVDTGGNPIANVDTTAPRLAPHANERPAWKDTVKCPPGYVTRIIAKFDLPTGTPTTPGQRFRYVWHCHILEHEDNEMMRPFDVIA